MNDLDFSNIATGSAVSSTPMGSLRVASEAGLYTKGHAVSNFENGNFVPIGNYIFGSGYPYTGIFCGNGKSITGLVISGNTSRVGLFGSTSGAAIKDLTLSSGSVTGTSYVGGVAGYNKGMIKNIHNAGTVISTKYAAVGGVVGLNESGTVSSSYNTGTVIGSNDGGVGGIAGFNNGILSDSYNTGAVTGLSDSVGGIAGRNYKILNSCYNTGAVTGTARVGGVAGMNIHNGTISDSYNTGTVTGGINVGGVVGEIESGVINGCWMDGSNLKNTAGIGAGSGITATFPAISPTITTIYTRMSAIASNAGGDETGAIADMVFGSDGAIPDVFQTLQGSYIFAQSDPAFTIYTISDDVTVAVTTGTSLGALLTSSEGGIIPTDTSNGSTFSFSGLDPGTWILVKAVDIENPKLSRIYTFYIK
jgi:hypothetical protein